MLASQVLYPYPNWLHSGDEAWQLLLLPRSSA